MNQATCEDRYPLDSSSGYRNAQLILSINDRVDEEDDYIEKHRSEESKNKTEECSLLRPLEPKRNTFEQDCDHDKSMVEEQEEISEKISREDWTRASPDKFAEMVRAALRVGLLVDAHSLVEKGHAMYPEHEDLARLAHLLAPPRRVGPPVPASSSTSLNYDWLSSHEAEYKDRWVALRDGQLVKSAPSYQELLDQLESSTGVFITRV